mmetsp:Transcript_4340/g.11784  ORF Transcript_4340/g.11784 Transcript_4340/m.11784 type:complete len:896 (-) Transcript_4340:395-3082(-)
MPESTRKTQMRSSSTGARPGSSMMARGKAHEDITAIADRLKAPMYISERVLLSDQQTVQAIEAILRIPGVSTRTEEELVVEYVDEDNLFTDPDFQPSPSSLFPDPDAPPATALDTVVWRRVSGALYLPNGKLPKIVQGAMLNHAFLGALAAVACKQELLLDLIASDDQAERGAYTMQFYKHGCWQGVVIDNYLPCVEGEDQLAYSYSGHVGELWPSFVEKAYAKLHGSYHSLEGGSVADCLTDLTGGVSDKIKLDEGEGSAAAQAGDLWDVLTRWLSEGGLVACKAKASSHPGAEGGSVDEAPDSTPEGIVYGQVYSIIDFRELPRSRARLLRLHCPWSNPGGNWHGAWSEGSEQWQIPEAQALEKELAAAPSSRLGAPDEAAFWMSYKDFIATFNRLHTCRLFPPHWHQLTLHCGWQGPSAGGPYYQPMQPGAEPLRSPTWCFNPQFRITVRKTCEVVVCLGLQDPRMEARRHVSKAARKRTAGMMVLRVPSSCLGRRWEISGPVEVVASTGLSGSRDSSITFQAESSAAYVVVPHTGRAGDEAAFVLRLFSSSPLEVEQLPSPLSLVIGGQWVGLLAGGSATAPTFGSNPQYMISTAHKAEVVFTVARLDVRYAVLKPLYSPEQCVGLYLCHPEVNAEGTSGRRTGIFRKEELVAESGFSSMDDAVMTVTLEPSTPYVLIPALAHPGLEAPFELSILSGVPVELVPLPELKTIVLQGSWRAETAGGCDLHPTWRKNPRFLLALQQPCSLRVILSRQRALAPSPSQTAAPPPTTSRPGTSASAKVTHLDGSLAAGNGHAGTPRRHAPLKGSCGVDDMLGFYILQASDVTGAIRGDLRKAIVAESTFVTSHTNSTEYNLQGGTPYVIIPCTYSPGRPGHFTLSLSAMEDFELVHL